MAHVLESRLGMAKPDSANTSARYILKHAYEPSRHKPDNQSPARAALPEAEAVHTSVALSVSVSLVGMKDSTSR